MPLEAAQSYYHPGPLARCPLDFGHIQTDQQLTSLVRRRHMYFNNSWTKCFETESSQSTVNILYLKIANLSLGKFIARADMFVPAIALIMYTLVNGDKN